MGVFSSRSTSIPQTDAPLTTEESQTEDSSDQEPKCNKTLKVLDVSLTSLTNDGIQTLLNSCPSLSVLFAVDCKNVSKDAIDIPKGMLYWLALN
jgi:hypothetical protein